MVASRCLKAPWWHAALPVLQSFQIRGAPGRVAPLGTPQLHFMGAPQRHVLADRSKFSGRLIHRVMGTFFVGPTIHVLKYVGTPLRLIVKHCWKKGKWFSDNFVDKFTASSLWILPVRSSCHECLMSHINQSLSFQRGV